MAARERPTAYDNPYRPRDPEGLFPLGLWADPPRTGPRRQGLRSSAHLQGFTQPALLLDFGPQTDLVPDRPHLRTNDTLLVARAYPALHPVAGDMPINADPPHLIVHALTQPQHLNAVAEQRIRQPVGAPFH